MFPLLSTTHFRTAVNKTFKFMARRPGLASIYDKISNKNGES
jgi:hypothetical protein